MHELVLILDFGSQYTQLIARRVRENHVYCEIHPYTLPVDKIRALQPKAIILSGSPSSIYETHAPLIGAEILEMPVPILGICYGLQLLARQYNGAVDKAPRREYGKAELCIDNDSDLLSGVDQQSVVWMSHGDHLNKLPDDFTIIGHTDNSALAAIRHDRLPVFGLQFHPEVHHSVQGGLILRNFLFNIAGCSADWTPGSFIEETIQRIHKQVKTGRVLCALSGGVDSSVTAVLLHKAIREQLTCVFVDNGLLRTNEREHVEATFRRNYKMNLVVVDASQLFYNNLKGIEDPEQKRKIIGNTFIEVFEQEAGKIGHVDFLAQGTLYPDLIESVSFKGPSATIKSHHNVGGLPEHMKLELVEPLKELFKDEVRAVGAELGIPHEILGRHPFPGPGLGVRILGDITPEKVRVLQQADKIFIDEILEHGEYDKIWQALTVLLPVKSVGVMGDSRTYENVVALRAVTSVDGMTADWYRMPAEILAVVSNRIINEVRGVNRVVYDVSSKPPSTIEWE